MGYTSYRNGGLIYMAYRITCTPEDDLQQKLSALPDDGEEAVITLEEGVFRQRLEIRRARTVLEGAGKGRTLITYALPAREILADGKKRGTFRTYTVLADGDDVRILGLTIENAAWPREEAGQCIALYADGPRFRAEDCALLSYQDTLFTAPLPPKEVEPNGFIGPKQFSPRTPSVQSYLRCEIRGDVDFIFGGASARFEDCDIVSADGRKDRTAPYVGYVCAPSTLPSLQEGYRFVGCRFIGKDVPEGSVYLARPWREGAMAVFERCELGSHIHPAGFADWAGRGKNGTTRFRETGCFGPGAAGPRADFVLP